MRATTMIVLSTVFAVLGFGLWFLTVKSPRIPARASIAQEVRAKLDPSPPSRDDALQTGEREASSVLEQRRVSPQSDEETSEPDDKSPSSAPDGDIDEEIARFDRNALEFDRRRLLLREELERGLLDREASLKWESHTQDLIAPDLVGVKVRAQCSETVCELIVQSPHPSGTLLAHSARFLRGLHEGTIGARESEAEPQDEAPAGDKVHEGFSVLIRRDDQKGVREFLVGDGQELP